MYRGIKNCMERSTLLLATGYSCRSQVKRYEHVVLKHPVQALLEILA